MAAAVAKSPAFAECMATAILQLATFDASGNVRQDAPDGPWHCAATDIGARFKGAGARTFGELVRAAASSPAFGLRWVAP